MLSFTGAAEKGKLHKVQTFVNESGKDTYTNQALLGIKYIDGQLRKGKAVMVGINKGDLKNINELVTDHYIIIAGKYKDDKRWYYHYLDPGTVYGWKGKDKEKNRLYINGNHVDNETSGYKLSQVRVNL